jgi:hypothetical protein
LGLDNLKGASVTFASPTVASVSLGYGSSLDVSFAIGEACEIASLGKHGNGSHPLRRHPVAL